MKEQRWVRGAGDFLAYSGSCRLTHILVWPDGDGDYADIYDGRDATSGKKFLRVECGGQTTRHISLGQGVLFHVGLYVDGIDAVVETTVIFIPEKVE